MCGTLLAMKLGKATCQRFNGIDLNGIAKGKVDDSDGKKERCIIPSKTPKYVIGYAQDGNKSLNDFVPVIFKILNKGISKTLRNTGPD